MTLLKEVIEKLNTDGRCTVIPFKVISFSYNELQPYSEFVYDENNIGYLLGHWAKRSVDENGNTISFIKDGNKIRVFKNF